MKLPLIGTFQVMPNVIVHNHGPQEFKDVYDFYPSNIRSIPALYIHGAILYMQGPIRPYANPNTTMISNYVLGTQKRDNGQETELINPKHGIIYIYRYRYYIHMYTDRDTLYITHYTLYTQRRVCMYVCMYCM